MDLTTPQVIAAIITGSVSLVGAVAGGAIVVFLDRRKTRLEVLRPIQATRRGAYTKFLGLMVHGTHYLRQDAPYDELEPVSNALSLIELVSTMEVRDAAVEYFAYVGNNPENTDEHRRLRRLFVAAARNELGITTLV